MSTSQNAGPSGSGIGKMIIWVTALCVLGVFGYKYLKGKGGSFTSVPEEVQINYIPADFQLDIDEENALAVLSNPHRYRREFNQLVFDVNMAILHHVANRMDLSDSLKNNIQFEYQKHHPYLRTLYFNDFVALKDTTSNLYQMWYDNESTNAVEILNEISSKYTCFLVNHVFSTLLPTSEGSIYVKGKNADTPCGVAITEGLKPMISRLQERASVLDFSRSRGLMQERVERVIAELATMEVRDKKGLNKRLQTKLWGFSISSSDIEVSAISILKVGFKLDQYFDVSLDSRRKQVTVTLPEPTILSHEVYPKIDKLDIGWMREVKSIDLNKNFNILREEFRRDAIESDIMQKAKNQASELMETMMGPLVHSINKSYRLKIAYKSLSPAYPDPDMGDNNVSVGLMME